MTSGFVGVLADKVKKMKGDSFWYFICQQWLHTFLSLVRLPIPPLSRFVKSIIYGLLLSGVDCCREFCRDCFPDSKGSSDGRLLRVDVALGCSNAGVSGDLL
jgi:hypothetical protein